MSEEKMETMNGDTAAWDKLARMMENKEVFTVQILETVKAGREVARDRRRQERKNRINAMQPGTVLEGTVQTIKPYGAFVDLGDGIDGLVHISQMSQKRINDPSEVVKEGDKVKVRIIKVADGKISLSMKTLEDAPVQEKEEPVDVSLYTTKENATTSLADLLKGFKFD